MHACSVFFLLALLTEGQKNVKEQLIQYKISTRISDLLKILEQLNETEMIQRIKASAEYAFDFKHEAEEKPVIKSQST